jgi:hypothetical protein
MYFGIAPIIAHDIPIDHGRMSVSRGGRQAIRSPPCRGVVGVSADNRENDAQYTPNNTGMIDLRPLNLK